MIRPASSPAEGKPFLLKVGLFIYYRKLRLIRIKILLA